MQLWTRLSPDIKEIKYKRILCVFKVGHLGNIVFLFQGKHGSASNSQFHYPSKADVDIKACLKFRKNSNCVIDVVLKDVGMKALCYSKWCSVKTTANQYTWKSGLEAWSPSLRSRRRSASHSRSCPAEITCILCSQPPSKQWIIYLASLRKAKFTPQEKNIDYAGSVDGFQFWISKVFHLIRGQGPFSFWVITGHWTLPHTTHFTWTEYMLHQLARTVGGRSS